MVEGKQSLKMDGADERKPWWEKTRMMEMSWFRTNAEMLPMRYKTSDMGRTCRRRMEKLGETRSSQLDQSYGGKTMYERRQSQNSMEKTLATARKHPAM
jgi:hypothetical protein